MSKTKCIAKSPTLALIEPCRKIFSFYTFLVFLFILFHLCLYFFIFAFVKHKEKTSKMKGSLQVIALRETGPGSENGYGFLGPWARFSTVTKCLRIPPRLCVSLGTRLIVYEQGVAFLR